MGTNKMEIRHISLKEGIEQLRMQYEEPNMSKWTRIKNKQDLGYVDILRVPRNCQLVVLDSADYMKLFSDTELKLIFRYCGRPFLMFQYKTSEKNTRARIDKFFPKETIQWENSFQTNWSHQTHLCVRNKYISASFKSLLSDNMNDNDTKVESGDISPATELSRGRTAESLENV